MDLQEVLTKIDNKELDGMSGAELGKAFILLSDKPEYKRQLKEVAAAINAKANEDKGQQASEQISEQAFTKNAIELNKYSEQAVLDEESKKALENLEVVTEDGRKVNVADEVNEAAKLRVTTDMVDRKAPLSQEEYNNAVHDEIARILSTIMISKSTAADGRSVQEANANAADLANLYNGKKVSVNASFVTNALAVHTGETKQKLSGLKEKFKNSSFFKGMKERLARLDDKLNKKFGPVYTKPKAVVNSMIEQGTMTEAILGGALGGAAIIAAGTAAAVPVSAAFGVYSAWIGSRRISSLANMYKKEKAAAEEQGQKLSFLDFAKTHKKDVVKTALYTGAAVAGIASAFYTTAAATIEGAHSLSSAAMHAGAAKLALTGAAIETPHVADFGEAVIKGDGKGAWNAAKRMGTAAAVFAGTIWAGQELMSQSHSDTLTMPGENGNDGVVPSDTTRVDQPVDTGVDSTETTDVNGTDTPVVTDNTMDPIVVGSREQAVYVRNLKLVPDHEIMLANIKDGIVEIPDGMTPEMAINMGRIEQLNYGDSRILQALRGCDDVKINLKDELYNLTKVTYTEIDGVHKLGDHIDFRGDPNIRGRIDSIDCDKVKVSRITQPDPIQEVEEDTTSGSTPPKPPVKDPDKIPTQAQQDTSTPPSEEVPNPNSNKEGTSNNKIHVKDSVELEEKFQERGITLNSNGELVNETTGQNQETTGTPSKGGTSQNMSKIHVDNSLQLQEEIDKRGIELKGEPINNTPASGQTSNSTSTYQDAEVMTWEINDAGVLVDANNNPVNTDKITINQEQLLKIRLGMSDKTQGM